MYGQREGDRNGSDRIRMRMWNPQGDGMGRRTGKRYDRSRLLIAAAFSVWSILLVLSGGFAVYAAEEDPVPTEPVNGVPLVIVRVDESEDAISSAQTDDPEHDYGTIADMNESEDHSVRCVGTVQVLVPEGFQGEYGSADVPADALELEYIRGRGNTTWQDSDDKKPYKIKLKKKADFFGMGENTEWALMANNMDQLLLENRITYWLASELGMPYTPQRIPADFVMVGSESGSTG